MRRQAPMSTCVPSNQRVRERSRIRRRLVVYLCAATELEAIGDKPRKRNVEAALTMTPQEARIARLVAEGRTNREVVAELFISPATVDYHLRKVYI